MKIWLVSFILIFFAVSVQSYTIDGDKVIQEDEFVRIEVSPYIAKHPTNTNFEQTIIVTNKTQSKKTNAYILLEYEKQTLNFKLEESIPSIYDWATHSETCDFQLRESYNIYSGERNPHEATCLSVDDTNGTESIKWIKQAKIIEAPTKRILYDVYEIVQPTKLVELTSNVLSVAHNNKEKKYLSNAMTINSGETKSFKITFTPNPTDLTGKWNLTYYTGNKADCILDNTCETVTILDPWWQNSASSRFPVNITANDNYDTTTTLFIKDINTTKSSWSNCNNNRLFLVRQDTNAVLDIDIEGVCGVSQDMNIAFRLPIGLNTNDSWNGTGINGLMLYIHDTNYSDAQIRQYRDFNAVYFYGDNFDTNTLGSYERSCDSNWNSGGWVVCKSGVAEQHIGYNVGVTPSNAILMMRQKSSNNDGFTSCLNALGSSGGNRGHCMGARDVTSVFKMQQPNETINTSTGVGGEAGFFFCTYILEVTDTNFAGFPRKIDRTDTNSSQNCRASTYERFFNDATKETGFNDKSNTRVNFGWASQAVTQMEIDWWKYFKFVKPASITVGNASTIVDGDFPSGATFGKDGNVISIAVRPKTISMPNDLNIANTGGTKTLYFWDWTSILVKDLVTNLGSATNRFLTGFFKALDVSEDVNATGVIRTDTNFMHHGKKVARVFDQNSELNPLIHTGTATAPALTASATVDFDPCFANTDYRVTVLGNGTTIVDTVTKDSACSFTISGDTDETWEWIAIGETS